MIAMIKLAFELDLTRVAAFTLSGGSSGQSNAIWIPSSSGNDSLDKVNQDCAAHGGIRMGGVGCNCGRDDACNKAMSDAGHSIL